MTRQRLPNLQESLGIISHYTHIHFNIQCGLWDTVQWAALNQLELPDGPGFCSELLNKGLARRGCLGKLLVPGSKKKFERGGKARCHGLWTLKKQSLEREPSGDRDWSWVSVVLGTRQKGKRHTELQKLSFSKERQLWTGPTLNPHSLLPPGAPNENTENLRTQTNKTSMDLYFLLPYMWCSSVPLRRLVEFCVPTL